ncbi:restriction endonuclease [Streptomyces tateyamensis]|uniref:Restriction endonuclease n=1 Tax=Streptomyces tateyamensis TaxID=565073 RepID=A0A2V4P727_9ACTN|nr:NaeI family type II restriction endonuclease [Streptomyces tateyamensis]PYC80538.1 restriction endonuclease [Streptomyces tateyamensis]
MDHGAEAEQSQLWAAWTEHDSQLDAVARKILDEDPAGRRFAGTIRRSIDMLLDGQHTGRFRWDQLYKTEKIHLGTLIEINLQREFAFADGERMDYQIAGVDVDCKVSQKRGSWMVPPEAHGELLLVVWASGSEAKWCAGLVRARPELLNPGGNRDGKRTLNAAGKNSVRCLFKDAPLQDNVLLRLPPEDITAIFSHKGGQRRLDELFLRAQRRLVSRSVVATVAMQEDYMRRVRGGGSSRTRLRPRGIVILGDYSSHGEVAQRLGLAVPQAGESLSARLTRLRADHGEVPWVDLDGVRWTLALPEDPEELAPNLPGI